MEQNSIDLPYNFIPRDYQIPLLEAMDRDNKKRLVSIMHRRAGKDKRGINIVAKKAFERVGNYFYLFPTYKQGKKILWNGIDGSGFKFMDHIPMSLRKRTDNSEMFIELINGSTFQIVGTDNIDSVVGSNPVGCVFSEYALQDPSAWNFIRPILAENDGWAVFIYTPRGKNHGYTLYQTAKKYPNEWFCERLTVEDTHAIPVERLRQEREEIINTTGDESLYLQEYMVDFNIPIQGAYYANQMLQADRDGRITRVPYDPALPVETWWDLGIGDSMAIWFVQKLGMERRAIDYIEDNNKGLNHYIKEIKSKEYIYSRHIAPHDIQVRELTTGKSRLESARQLGIEFDVAPMLPVDDGINAVRNLLPKFWFDEVKCEKGISALRSYHKSFNEKLNIWSDKPEHDWASHGADSFRTGAVSDIVYEKDTRAIIGKTIDDPY